MSWLRETWRRRRELHDLARTAPPAEVDPPPRVNAEDLSALATIVEQTAGTAYDLALEGRAREQVVQAAIAAIGRLADQADRAEGEQR